MPRPMPWEPPVTSATRLPSAIGPSRSLPGGNAGGGGGLRGYTVSRRRTASSSSAPVSPASATSPRTITVMRSARSRANS